MPLFNLDPPKPKTRAQQNEEDRENIRFCLKHTRYLNEWEKRFLVGVSGYKHLSPDQRDKLGLIRAKIDAALQIEGERRTANEL